MQLLQRREFVGALQLRSVQGEPAGQLHVSIHRARGSTLSQGGRTTKMSEDADLADLLQVGSMT